MCNDYTHTIHIPITIYYTHELHILQDIFTITGYKMDKL